jgi:hypothetical protein
MSVSVAEATSEAGSAEEVVAASAGVIEIITITLLRTRKTVKVVTTKKAMAAFGKT